MCRMLYRLYGAAFRDTEGIQRGYSEDTQKLHIEIQSNAMGSFSGESPASNWKTQLEIESLLICFKGKQLVFVLIL